MPLYNEHSYFCHASNLCIISAIFTLQWKLLHCQKSMFCSARIAMLCLFLAASWSSVFVHWSCKTKQCTTERMFHYQVSTVEAAHAIAELVIAGPHRPQAHQLGCRLRAHLPHARANHPHPVSSPSGGGISTACGAPSRPRRRHRLLCDAAAGHSPFSGRFIPLRQKKKRSPDTQNNSVVR